MSDTIQQIVIELALKGGSSALSAAQSRRKVVDGSRRLRRRAVSTAAAESMRSVFIPVSGVISSPALEWESQMDVLSSNQDVASLFSPVPEEGRYVEDRLTSSGTETSLATMMARSLSDETSIATAPVGIASNKADLLHHTSGQRGTASFHPRQEVGTHIDSTVRRKLHPPRQTTNGSQYLDNTDQNRALRSQIGVTIQGVSEERIAWLRHRADQLDATSYPSLSDRQTNSGPRQRLVRRRSSVSMNDLINKSQPPRALIQSQDQWEQPPVPTATNANIPVGIQQERANSTTISFQTVSGSLAPALRGEGWGEGIRRYQPLSIQHNPLNRGRHHSRSTSGHLQYEPQLMPPIWHEVRSQSLDPPEQITETASEPFWDEHKDYSPSFVRADSMQTETLSSEAENPGHRFDTPEYFPLTVNMPAQVTRGASDAYGSNRLPHSVPRSDNHSSDDFSPSESVERPFLIDEMEARLESLFRVQEERFKSTIKNLAYWLK